MKESPEDEIQLPSEPVLSQEETIRQLRADYSRCLQNKVNLLNTEVADMKQQLADNLEALRGIHNNYISLASAVLGDTPAGRPIGEIVRLATEQRELAEMFREAKK